VSRTSTDTGPRLVTRRSWVRRAALVFVALALTVPGLTSWLGDGLDPRAVESWSSKLTSHGRSSASTNVAGSVTTAPPVPGGFNSSGFGPIVAAPEPGRLFAGSCAVEPASDTRVDVALAVHKTFLCVGARLGWLDDAPKPGPGSDAFPSRAHQHAAEAVAVAWCESTLDPAASNPSSSARGVFQVLRQHSWLFERYGSSWREGGLDPVLSMAVAADLQSWLVQRGHEPWSDWESANALGSEAVGGPVLVGILPAQHSVRAESRHLAAPALPTWAADPAGDAVIGGSCWSVWQGGGW
jgi:hypothetical protein